MIVSIYLMVLPWSRNIQPLRGMGEKLRDLPKANVRTQKLLGSSGSRSHQPVWTALGKAMVNHPSTLPPTSMDTHSEIHKDIVLQYDEFGSEPKGRPNTEQYRRKRNIQSFWKTHQIGTRNVRNMNQGKLEIVKKEMAWMKINILGISELKWTRSGHVDSNDTVRRNGVALIIEKKIASATTGYNLKNERMISVRIQGTPINTTIIQIYAPTTDAAEETIEKFYTDLQQLIDDAPKKDNILLLGDWNAKIGNKEEPEVTGKFGLGNRNAAGNRLVEFCQENKLIITNTCFKQPNRRLYTWTSPNGKHRNQIDFIVCSKRWRSSVLSVSTRPGADCGTDHQLLLATFRIKLRKNQELVKPTRYDLENIPYTYQVNVNNRVSELALQDNEPEETWTKIHKIITEEAKQQIPRVEMKKKPK